MKDDRREFLKTSAKWMGVLAAFGLTGSKVSAQTPSPLQTPGAMPSGPMQKLPPGTRPGPPGVKAMPGTAAAPKAAVLNSVISDALVTKDMGKSLPKFKNQLTPAQYGALQRLTPADLGQLESIKNKLGPINPVAEGDTGGDRGFIFW